MRHVWIILLAFVCCALTTACGARSELRVRFRDAAVDGMDVIVPIEGGPVPDVRSLCLHFTDVAPTDATADAGPECLSDGECRTRMLRPFCDVRSRVCVQCRGAGDCPAGEDCSLGTCAAPCRGSFCLTSLTCCGSYCIDTQSDRNNCGMCGVRCTGECVAGVCAGPCPGGCPAEQTCCGGVCRNLHIDRYSCGACDVPCPTGTQCLDGTCGPVTCRRPCSYGEACCGTFCTNIYYDPLHCGSCTRECAFGESCREGTCVLPCSSGICAAGQSCCGSVCTDFTRDPLNCRSCSHVCGLGEACIDATCTPVGPTGAYSVAPSTQPFVDACSAAAHGGYLAGVDDAIATFTLPFPFTFFGCTDVDAWVSSNGVVGIGSAPSNEYNNDCLPNQFALRGTILAFWDDIAMRDGVCTATTGPPGNRLFVIQWKNAYFYASNMDARLDFEVVLHEGTNVIDVVYQSMTDGTEPGRGSGGQATIGLVDAFGAGAVQSSCNTSAIHAPQAIRFTPQ